MTTQKESNFIQNLCQADQCDRLKVILVGSSNLTSGEQKRNIEANVLLRIEESIDAEAKNFEQDATNFCNNLWETATILKDKDIEDYEKGEKAIIETRKTVDKLPITKVSDTEARHIIWGRTKAKLCSGTKKIQTSH